VQSSCEAIEKLHEEVISVAFKLNEVVQMPLNAKNILLWKVKLERLRELCSVLPREVTPNHSFSHSLEKQLDLEPAK
jgi:hypothetical protein